MVFRVYTRTEDAGREWPCALGSLGRERGRPLPLGPTQLTQPLVSPQVSIRLDGENKAVEYNAVGAMQDAVRVVFRGTRVDDLFDREWHKLALSIQAQSASLYIDCALVQTLPLEERENIDIQGKTVIGKRLYDSVPIDVSTNQVLGSRGGASGSRAPHAVPPHLPVSFVKSSPRSVLERRTLTQNCHVGAHGHITRSLTHSISHSGSH